MSQTVTQNSALSQDWVKCPVCTHPRPRLRTRCALGRPYRGAPGAVSWLYRSARPAVWRAVPRTPCRHAPMRRVAARPHVVSQRARERCCAPCHSEPESAAAHRVTAPLGRVARLPVVSWCMPGRVAALYCDTASGQAFLLSRYKPSLPPVTIQTIVS